MLVNSMPHLLRWPLVLLFCIGVFAAHAQWTPQRLKVLVSNADTLQLDSMAIWPNSLTIYYQGAKLAPEHYAFQSQQAKLYVRDIPAGDTLQVSYAVLPWRAGLIYQRKDPNMIQQESAGSLRPFVLGNQTETSFTDDKAIQKNGSISRGILFGNNQNLSVNSTLNLQLSGQVTDRIGLLASITDDNIPIQPSGNTQQLQDFDQVYIQLFDDKTKVIAGDFQLRRPAGYFMNYMKRAQGLYTITERQVSASNSFTVEASASISKGRFARNVFQGIEGNQGPYRLKGTDNELFIIILSGTELVYIDGRLLERGMDKDYVIDYNSAEISFTPRNLITKDRRITVEFQYSERRYARPMLQAASTWRTGASSFFLNIYSESDARNQPLQQDLNDQDKLALAAGGDNYLATFRSGIDSLGYTNNEVRYAMIDTLGFDSVFVFSTDSTRAFYRVNFSFVGLGNGDYVENGFSANGKTYQWVSPVFDGTQWLKQGSYAPIALLVAPKKNQMISAGFSVPVGETERLVWSGEAALSNRDLNTFSMLDANDDVGAAARTRLQWNEFKNQNEINSWAADSMKRTRTSVSATYEYTQRHFNGIERFREVEFIRNWNLTTVAPASADQHWVGFQAIRRNKSWGKASASIDALHMPSVFNGYRAKFNADVLTQSKWKSMMEGSALQTSGMTRSLFARHKGQTSKDIGKLRLKLFDEYERNLYRTADSIQFTSYEFLEWEASIGNADTVKKSIRFFYRERTDRKPKQEILQPAAHAEQYGMQWIQRWKNESRLVLMASNRRLRVVDPELFTASPENTLVGRVEYGSKLWKGSIQNTTFYEVGSGLEQRREFIYLEVPAGQGIYIWNDYNADGVKDLNEFEVAAFAYEANYVRSFVQSNDYVKTYTNQFSESFTFQPSRVLKGAKPVGRWLSRLSSATTFRLERKTSREDGYERFNPFTSQLPDSILLASQGVIRNIIYLNKANPVFGMDYTHQILDNRNLLSNGFERRRDAMHQLALRWNFWKAFSVFQEARVGEKGAESDFLSGRNFLIKSIQIQPKLTYQPSPKLKASILGQYTDKKNILAFEKAIVLRAGAECNWNLPEKGSVRAEANFYRIDFNGVTTNSLAFEMLEGLQPGYNYTWQLAWQRNVAENIQLNIQYNGRKPQDIPVIHSGSVQVRAVF